MRARPSRAAFGGPPLSRALAAAPPLVLLLAGACADPSLAPRASTGPPRSSAAAPGAADTPADGYIVFLNTPPERESSERASSGGVTRAVWTAASTADLAAVTKVAGGAARVQALGFMPAFVARGGVDVAALRADPRVARVARNPRYFKLASATGAPEGAFAAAGATTADAFATNATFWRRGWQWNLKQIRADRAAATGAGRIACIIDAGVNKNHVDLQGKVAAERAFPGGAPFPPDGGDLDHGSYVASIVTSNGIGIASVAPGARLMNANVFGPDGGTSGAQIIDAMAWCSQNGADVINVSIDGPQTRGTPGWVEDSTTLTNAVQAARGRGTVVVVAAGNEGQGIPSTAPGETESPAEATGVIAVGATAPPGDTGFPFAVPAPAARYDQLAGYSTRNSGRDDLGPGVRIYAPGGAGGGTAQLNVLGVCSSKAGPACSTNDRYSAAAGTSASSPHVTGVVALIASRTNAPRSLARVRAIEACLLATADRLPAGPPFFGRGRVNAERATTASCPGL